MDSWACVQNKQHLLRYLRVRFRRIPLQGEREVSRASSPRPQAKTSRDPGSFAPTPPRENEASTKMNSVASVQDKLHPLRLLQVRFLRMSQQRETGDPAGMDMIARLQEKLLPLRHRRVWLRPLPQRENEATDSVNSRASSPQAQRQLRNPTNTTRNLEPFVWVRLQCGLLAKQTMPIK
jgi:hypothetical protein